MLYTTCLYPLIHCTRPLKLSSLHLFSMCVGEREGIHRPCHGYGTQQKALRCQFSLFTALALGLELRLSGLAANTFTCWILLVTFWDSFSKWTRAHGLAIVTGQQAPESYLSAPPALVLQRFSVLSVYDVGTGDPNSGPHVSTLAQT